ncbi:sigma factor-like helix-turn-helix DNA-binding protein [Priestia megaterium]|uniref:sigma factor-like helix-turn-helix DNA-binding protein n=1 Tax=Priestia megaterium TaxID=1404 RepID=UPI0031451EB1
MENHLFSFMDNVHTDFSDIGAEIEAKLFLDPSAVLMKARVYAEQLTKAVNEKEEIEEMYGIKQHERLYKLHKEEIMITDIYERFDWLRKAGNKAAHEANYGKVEDAIQAHRYLYDISVWFMEVYGDLSFKAPSYKLPKAQANSSIEKEDLQDVLNESLNKMFGEKFEAVLDLVRKNMVENEKEKVVAKVEIDKGTNEVASAEEIVQEEKSTSMLSLIQYLQQHSLEVIDKRSSGGTLWVVGGWELNEILFGLKEHKIYFRYAKKGSRSTQNRPGWFLLNKTKEELYIEHEEVVFSDNLEPEPKNEKKLEPIAKKQVFSIIDAISYTELNDTGLIVPTHLLNKDWGESPLGIFLSKSSSSVLEKIELDTFRSYYVDNREDFFKLMMQLGFLGVQFQGSLANLASFVADQTEGYLKVHNPEQYVLQDLFPIHFRSLFAKNDIKKTKDVNFLPVSSLKWLFKDFEEELLSILKKCDEPIVEEKVLPPFLEKENENQTTLAHFPSDKSENDIPQITSESITDDGSELTYRVAEENLNGKLISYHNKELCIPEGLLDEKLTEELFPNCKNVVKQLQNQHIQLFKELPQTLDNIHEKLMAVGVGRVKKFWERLIELAGEDSISQEEAKVAQGEGIEFNDQIIEFSLSFRQRSIKEDHFTSVDGLINHLTENGIEKYQKLPAKFEELLAVPKCGRGRIIKFFEQINQNMIQFEEEQKYQGNLESMSDEERVLYFFDNFVNKIESILEDENQRKIHKIQERGLEMMHRKHEERLQGNHLTLEAIAQIYGVTRERIRQINKKLLERIATLGTNWINEVNSQLQEEQIILNKYLQVEKFSHYLIMEYFQVKNVIFLFDEQVMTVLDRSTQEEIEKYIYKSLIEKFKGILFSELDLKEFIEEQKGNSLYARYAVQEWVIPSANQHMILKSTNKTQVVEMVMRQYPEGIEVYKKAQELCEQGNMIVSDMFSSDREFTGVVVRDDFSAAYLWGRGLYIHKSYVNIPHSLIKEIDKKVSEWLQEHPIMMIGKVFNYFEKELTEKNIPNEYALYTLLREANHDNGVAYPKFPKITNEGEEFKYNSELICEFIREHGPSVLTETLHNEFVEKLGWKSFTLGWNLSSKEEFLQETSSSYTLLEFYDHLTKDKLQIIATKLERKLQISSFFQATGLFNELESLCRSLGIHSPHLLYGILKNRFHEEFLFPHYPHILNVGAESDSVSMIKIVESYLLEQGCEIPREELVDWMVSDVGGSVRTIDMTLSSSDNILYYTRGKFGEYIHKEVIGWNEEKALKLRQVALETLENESNQIFTLARDVDLEELPHLDIDILWTETLFINCLQRDEMFSTFGSLNSIFSKREDGMRSNTDFVEHVLKKEFDGAAKLSELGKFLQKVQYTSDGDLLHETLVEIKDGKAPFVLVGDELILKSLMKIG